ncbi:MAG: type II toxin-antitoxin system HicA family toxin [Planctomycetes bacterium]|nr:type II toxin-antitoxin system HicA family toxin [Planctomycetota bacterium]
MMVQLPVVSGAAAVRAFERAAWRKDRQKGSHVIMVKSGHIASLSIPQHRELAPGTLRALIRAAQMKVEDFVDLL